METSLKMLPLILPVSGMTGCHPSLQSLPTGM
jgi:hypothetical protein